MNNQRNIIKYQQNVNLNRISSSSGVDEQQINWLPFAFADLQYVIEMANKSILSKLQDRQIIGNLKGFQNILHTQVQDTDVNGYFWIMMIINRLLDDDHSSIKLNNLQQIQTLDFNGVIFDSKIQDGKLIVYVIRSFLKDVYVGDQVIKINGIPTLQFVKKNAKKYIKSTYSPVANLKKYILYMCLFNPFDPIYELELKSENNIKQKQVNIIKPTTTRSNNKTKYTYKKTADGTIIKLSNIQYYNANQRYFQGYNNIFELMRDMLIQDEPRQTQLDITTLKQGKLLYYDLHQFLNFGDNVQKLEQSIQLIDNPKYEWIVIDLRNNAGGSVYLSLLLSAYLFDVDIARQYKDCQTASFNLNEEFLQKYNEQYIIPVIADPEVSPQIKQKFIQMQQYLFKRQQSLFLNTNTNKSTQKKCKKDLLTGFNRELSSFILRNDKKQLESQTTKTVKGFKKIILITNLHCYSACIHTYNFMRLFPNVVTIGQQIGQTTGSGNSIQIQLPSQQAHVVLPQLYVNNINPIFNSSMTNSQTVDIQLDTDVLMSKQALIVFILENKKKITDIIKRRATAILNR